MNHNNSVVESVPLQTAEDLSQDESSSENEASFSWVGAFCDRRGNEFFCEVDSFFLQDRFNLTGLGHEVPLAQRALDRITDELEQGTGSANISAKTGTPSKPSMNDDDNEVEDLENSQIENSARMLYGLIHARYIISPFGMSRMKRKFIAQDFGSCPRILCRGTSLLPVGLSDVPGVASVKLYCWRCRDVYNPRHSVYSSVDGAFFGTTFPHLFSQQYPSLTSIDEINSTPENASERGLLGSSSSVYVPRIFGFRIAQKAGRDLFSLLL